MSRLSSGQRRTDVLLVPLVCPTGQAAIDQEAGR